MSTTSLATTPKLRFVPDPDPLAEFMTGFPPAADRRIRFDDGSFYAWPQMKWSFNHIEDLVPTRTVWRGDGASRPFEAGDPLDTAQIRFDTADGRTLGWDEAYDELHTDGLVVLHRGRLVHESYGGHGSADLPHVIMSCAKSFVGTIATWLVHEGSLDRDALVPTLIPELADSAWRDATVGQVLDMLVSMTFDGDYLDPGSEVYRYLRSAGMLPMAPDDPGPRSFYDYLPEVRPAGRHGEAFAYREPNINVLGWLVRRASGRGLADLVSERIWRHLGAERDAAFMLDPSGAETTMTMTVRDFARFGEMIRCGGRVGDVQVVPEAVADDPFLGGDPDLFTGAGPETMAGGSYRSQWWIRHIDAPEQARQGSQGDSHGSTRPMARGAHGQFLYVDRANQVVIARTGSSRLPPSTLLDPVVFPLFDAVIAELTSAPVDDAP